MMPPEAEEKRRWWKEGVVYQIYPRSFKDSNGDGIGDLPGIIEKLDYLEWLGVDIVWLNPVYESPNDDNGYDISNYQVLQKEFGTMDEFAQLLEGLHARGIRLVMDLVVNHTSDEHSWFVESRSSLNNPKRDYYIWRPGKGPGIPPNNWASFFEGSAWEYDPPSGEYYLHLFSRKQPDLNWENQDVRNEVHDLMRFWLEKGIDGFRMDVINLIAKSPGLPDGSPDSGFRTLGGEHFTNGPRMADFLGEMKEEVLSRYDIMTVGETPDVTPEIALRYVDSRDGGLNMIFSFDPMDIDFGDEGYWSYKPWKLSDLKRVISAWQVKMHGKGWNSLYLNNHDQPRMVSRFGDDREYRVESAKLLGTLTHTLQGTPYIYQGEEIGMTNTVFSSIGDVRDVAAKNFCLRALSEGMKESEILRLIHIRGRDNSRTPMQWNSDLHGGFTTGAPWIGVNPNYKEINVEAEENDPASILNYYRALINIRKKFPVLVYGNYTLLFPEDEDLYVFERQLDADSDALERCEPRDPQSALVLLNFSGAEKTVEISPAGRELLLSNYDSNYDSNYGAPGIFSGPESGNGSRISGGRIRLRPWEARIYLSVCKPRRVTQHLSP